MVTDKSEASTKSTWSTHLRQYKTTRIIFTTDSCLFEKTSKTKIPLISLSNCCRWDSTYKKGYLQASGWIRLVLTNQEKKRSFKFTNLIFWKVWYDLLSTPLPSPSIPQKKRDRKLREKWPLIVFWFIRQTCRFWTENDHWSTKNYKHIYHHHLPYLSPERPWTHMSSHMYRSYISCDMY